MNGGVNGNAFLRHVKADILFAKLHYLEKSGFNQIFAKEGYKFVGWYVYSKYFTGEDNVFLLSTEDEAIMVIGNALRVEARYEPIG